MFNSIKHSASFWTLPVSRHPYILTYLSNYVNRFWIPVARYLIRNLNNCFASPFSFLGNFSYLRRGRLGIWLLVKPYLSYRLPFIRANIVGSRDEMWRWYHVLLFLSRCRISFITTHPGAWLSPAHSNPEKFTGLSLFILSRSTFTCTAYTTTLTYCLLTWGNLLHASGYVHTH